MKRSEHLGVSVEKKRDVGHFYVISKMDVNVVAAKSKQFRMGAEIVEARGCGLHGMLIVAGNHRIANSERTDFSFLR